MPFYLTAPSFLTIDTIFVLFPVKKQLVHFLLFGLGALGIAMMVLTAPSFLTIDTILCAFSCEKTTCPFSAVWFGTRH